jgi:hypothetical protein
MGKNINMLIPELFYKDKELLNLNIELTGHRKDSSVLPIEVYNK